MQGNEFVWIASIILGMTVLGWLVLDWLESAQGWDRQDVDGVGSPAALGRSEQQMLDELEVELELMRCYPLDPFAPTLHWRPMPNENWGEASATADAPSRAGAHTVNADDALRTGEASS